MRQELEVIAVLHEVLGLRDRGVRMNRESPLLGAIPELDSMGMVAVITTLEERFGISIADDDLDASSFETVGSLADYVAQKVAA